MNRSIKASLSIQGLNHVSAAARPLPGLMSPKTAVPTQSECPNLVLTPKEMRNEDEDTDMAIDGTTASTADTPSLVSSIDTTTETECSERIETTWFTRFLRRPSTASQ